MHRIGITGPRGFIAQHLQAYLHGLPDTEVVSADRAVLANDTLARRFVSGCDTIVHLAGMNRGNDAELERENTAVTRSLVRALEDEQVAPHVLFSSSTHEQRDTAYGRSKRTCSRVLREWAEHRGAPFTNVIIPNVFGEGGRPFYNSVVSTFCHQLAHSDTPTIQNDARLEQVHAQTLARELHRLALARSHGDARIAGRAITVSELLDRLRDFAASYRNHVIPEFRSDFDLDLFNTYRSYLYPQQSPVPLRLHTDNRGSLFEAVKSRHCGQCFVSTTLPGITRGNHYHLRKFERFLVLSGEAEIHIRRLLTHDVQVFRLSGTEPRYVDIPTLHTHSITNVGTEILTTLFWAHEFFDPQAPDTFAEPVLPAVESV